MKATGLILKLKSNKLIIDSFWAIIGNVIGKGLSFAAGVVVARILGRESFGEYAAIIATLVSASVFSTFGLGYTATKFIADLKNKNNADIGSVVYFALLITLVTSVIFALAIFVSADYISLVLFRSNNLGVSIKIVSFWVVFNALTTTQVGVLAGLGQFKKMAKINTYVGFFTFLSSISGALMWGLNGFLIGVLCNQIFNWVVNTFVLKSEIKKISFAPKNRRLLVKEMIQFSTPVAMQEALYSLSSFILPYLFITYSNIGELGLYTASTQISALILFIPGILRNVFLMHFSQTKNDKSLDPQTFKLTIMINLLSTVIPVIVVFILIDYISNIYGSEYLGIGRLIIISCITAIITSISNVYVQLYLSVGKNWYVFFVRLLRDTILITSFILLINGEIMASRAFTILSLFSSTIYFVLLHLKWRNLENYREGAFESAGNMQR